MKTYPYTTPEGIIELVRKDEHDAIVAELLARLEERTASHLAASARDVQTIQQQSVLLDRLATALSCAHHAFEHVPVTREVEMLASNTQNVICDALAAYESSKSGNLPEPLAEAVKRMEEVPESEMVNAYCEGPGTRGVFGGCDRVRARLIQAAKGDQP